MVTGWVDDHRVEVTSPQGRTTIEASVIILATGARERPRPARMVPGDRPAGVYTTGQLQNLVHPGAPRSRDPRGDRRRRARQLVGGDDPSRGSLRDPADDQRVLAPRGLRRVHGSRPARTTRPGRHPHARHSNHRPRQGDGHDQDECGTRIESGRGLRWITPSVLVSGVEPARSRLLAWPNRPILLPTVTIRDGGRTVARRRLPWPASPGRVFRIPTAILPTARGRGTITVDVE